MPLGSNCSEDRLGPPIQISEDRADPPHLNKYLAALNFDVAGEDDIGRAGQGDVADFIAYPGEIDLQGVPASHA